MREGPRLRRLRAMPPQQAWGDVRSSPEPEQVALWLELFRRTFDDARYAAACARADDAVRRLDGRTVEDWLRGRGVTVASSVAPSTFGTAIIRAWFDLDHATINIFESPLDALEEVFAHCGQSAPQRDAMRAAVLGHEAYHALDPTCPGEIAEWAAHLFAARVSDLGCFAGVLDVMQALARKWAL